MRLITLLFSSLVFLLFASTSTAAAHSSRVHHRSVTRWVAPSLPEARLRRPIDLETAYPDHALIVGWSATVLTDAALGPSPALFDRGFGVDLNMGLRLGRGVSFLTSWVATLHPDANLTEGNTGTLGALSFDVRTFVAPKWTDFEPFLQLGAGILVFDRASDSSELFDGVCLQGGMGAHIRLNKRTAITTTLLYRPTVFVSHQPQSAGTVSDLVTASVGLTFRL